MNKLVKGSIAGAAGIALLLGGAGTFALWNDSATLTDAGTVASGQLEITDTTGGTWVDLKNNNNNPVDISNFKIVPGDHLKYTEDLELVVSGDNLKFTVTETISDILTTSGGLNVKSNNVLSSDVSVTDLGGVLQNPSSAGQYKLSDGTYTIAVSIDVNFAATLVDGLTGQLDSLDLSDAKVTVTQVTN